MKTIHKAVRKLSSAPATSAATILLVGFFSMSAFAGEKIEGTFKTSADKPTFDKPLINSMEFKADGTVDLTVTEGIWERGAKTTYRTSTVRSSYTAATIQFYIAKLKGAELSDPFTIELQDYLKKGYEFVFYTAGKYAHVYVMKGKEIVELQEGLVYKKAWW